MLSSPPPPPIPPPPPLSPPLFPAEVRAAGEHHGSYNPSILIIVAIIAFAIIAAASIHLLLRTLARSRNPLLVHHLSSSPSSSSPSSPASSSPPSPPSGPDPKAVIDSLPLFSLSSATSKSATTLDCAVCLSPFQLTDELRLLPSCRHAFHSECIDTWLKSNLSCPLCRSTIRPILHPPPPPAPQQAEPSRSESFRVEIGSVSRRTDDSSATAPPSHARSYSLGSSFDYVVEEEIEAVLARVRQRPPTIEKSDLEAAEAAPAQPPPGAELAEIAGAGQRSWLRDYVDRLASSASSSFSSLRFSQRGSQRFGATTGGDAGADSWDLERNLHLHLEEDDGGFAAFYRWLVGV